jgi:PTS system nitrogen regulatory IIA component
MNAVAQLFSPGDVLLDLELPNKQALFDAVGRLWEEHHGIAATEVVESLNAREDLGSTGLGQGVAIPHARIKSMSKAIAAFVRPKMPMEFDSPDDKPVAYCFVLLVPAQATEQHLQILADVAEMLSSEQFRTQLGVAKSASEIHQLFSTWNGANSGRK